MNITNATDCAELSTLLNNTPVAFLDFHAKWCGPCKQAMPEMAALAGEFPQVPFVKINVDEADGGIIEIFEVKSLPLFVVLVKGQVVRKWTGYTAKNTFAEIKAVISKSLEVLQQS